jgi:hypothetical protein
VLPVIFVCSEIAPAVSVVSGADISASDMQDVAAERMARSKMQCFFIGFVVFFQGAKILNIYCIKYPENSSFLVIFV